MTASQPAPGHPGSPSSILSQNHSWLTLGVCFALLVFLIVRPTAVALKPGLRSIPGPTVAPFTPFYRLWKIAKGDAPDFYLRLHRQYGRIVRTGPKTVDISDPKALPIIYGISSKFLKVGIIKLQLRTF